jgi:hypothetical protein
MAKPNMVIDGGGDPFASATDTPVSMTTWIVNLLKNVPELKAIYDTVRDPVTGKYLYNAAAIVDMITSSSWYLENGPTVAGNIAARYKFGEKYYQQKINEFKISISGLATAIGLDMADPDTADYLSSLAETAYLNNWDNDYIENTIISNKDIFGKIQGGAYATAVQDLASYSNLMGFSMSEQSRADYQRRLIGSTTKEGLRVRATPDDIKREINAKAAQLYPFLSDDFTAGRTLWDVTSVQRKKWADLLEVDEDTLDWNDPLWKDGKIFSMVDEKTGKMVMRPSWDAEKLIKQDERWQYTENATRLYEGYGIGMLNKFGLAAI